jgi:hypothetical protein
MKIIRWLGRNVVLIVLLISAIFFVGTVRMAWGTEDCRGHSCNDSGGDITIGGDDISVPVDVSVNGGAIDVAGDTLNLSTGGNKPYNAVAPGLGDVDIAQCLGSTQWSFLVGGKQKLVLNQVCMAEFYLKQGRFELAAQALCNQPEVLAEYETELSCEQAHNFSPGPLRAVISYEYYEDIEQVQMAQNGLVNRVDQLEKRINRPAPKTKPPASPGPVFSKEQIDAVWNALEDKEEDDER